METFVRDKGDKRMDAKSMIFDRLSLKKYGWLLVLLAVLLCILPFLLGKLYDPFPGDKPWKQILSVIILLLCEELYRFIREWIKKIIYEKAGKSTQIDFLRRTYGKANEPVSAKLFTTANLLSCLIPCIISSVLILILPEDHFWKAYIVIMSALPETVEICVFLLLNRKKIKGREMIDEGRYVYVLNEHCEGE